MLQPLFSFSEITALDKSIMNYIAAGEYFRRKYLDLI